MIRESLLVCAMLAPGLLAAPPEPAPPVPPGPSAPPVAPAAGAVDEAERWLTDAGDGLLAAARWLEANATHERLQQLVDDTSTSIDEALQSAIERARAEAGKTLGLRAYAPGPGGFTPGAWVRPEPAGSEPLGTPPRAHVVLLIHGLDEPGDVWADLAPRLAAEGHAVARFDYPNDQGIAASADGLLAALRELRTQHGAERVSMVGHSMGGLIAREVLTRTAPYAGAAAPRDTEAEHPTVARLIMVGTPNHGSGLARFRAVAEVRDHFARWIASGGTHAPSLLGFIADGDGQAGRDLMPGSEFLTRLNRRALLLPPKGPSVTNIIGRLRPVKESEIASVLDTRVVRAILSAEERASIEQACAGALGELGDGVVPESSARLAGVTDEVILAANHRTLIRGSMLGLEPAPAGAAPKDSQPSRIPPAVTVILDRLAPERPL